MAEGLSSERIEIRHRAPARGVLDGLDLDGTVRVRFGDRLMPASIAMGCSDAEILSAIRTQAEVLLVFIDDDPELPVIVGLLRRRLVPQGGGAEAVRERFLALEASEGIRLRAGDASIELRPDGRVEIRGTEVVSAAESTNRILGGTVAIN
ncbi:MAG: DUF6484 domain-containing protein [Polyangiaceae bacterium]